MYRLQPHYEIMDVKPSTVMYACESFQKDLEAAFGGEQITKPMVIAAVKTSPTKDVSNKSAKKNAKSNAGQNQTAQPTGASDFEHRQLALLSELQTLGTRLDKLSGKPDNKKRGSAQAKDVKRQKTESMSQEIIEEPEPEEHLVLIDGSFAMYESCLHDYGNEIKEESKPNFKKLFPLNVIFNSDSSPPLSLFVLASLLRERLASSGIRMGIKLFNHSSTGKIEMGSKKAQILPDFYVAANDGINDINQCDVMLNFIWKKDTRSKEPRLLHGACVESATSHISGEFAIAKYLATLAGFHPIAGVTPEGSFLMLDYWLNTASAFVKSTSSNLRRNVLKEMNEKLGKRQFLIGAHLSFIDVIVWSVLNQAGVNRRKKSILPLPSNVQKWFLTLDSVKTFQAARILIR